MNRKTFARIISILLVAVMCVSAVLSTGCTNGTGSAGTTPESSSSNAPGESSTPEASSPAESSPSEPTAYSISYDLDGGYDGGNPVGYNGDTDVVISKTPIKPGYNFAGWTGSGLTEATKTVTIAKGTTGDLSFKATWVENSSDISADGLDRKYFNADKNIVAKEGDMPISVHSSLGARGEGIHILKTVYTTVDIDGTMDAAYTYGLHFEGDIMHKTDYYNASRPRAYFDVYMIRSQDGYINIFIEVVDPEIVVNSYIYKELNTYWHCDSIDFYYEYGNYGVGNNVCNFIADDTGAYKRSNNPAKTKIKMTSTGYVIETAFDNAGVPFNENDELGFGFYLNDTRDWDPVAKTYTKNLMKNHSVLNPVGTKYQSPTTNHDAVRVSLESATGAVDVGAGTPEKTGDMITDILNGSASLLVTYDQYATAQTIIAGQNIRNIVLGVGGTVYVCEESEITEDMVYDYEILLGKTTREESAALVNSLNYNNYAVSVGKDTIALVGWNEEAANAAYSILFEMFDHVLGGGSTADITGSYVGTLEHINGDPTLKLEGFDSITDVGEDAYLIYKLESTMAEYEAYCAKLAAGGYTLYTTNQMSKVMCATYYNDDTVINVQFANGGERTMQNLTPDNSLRIVVEPLSNTVLPALEKPDDANAKVTVSSISQLYPHNLCLVVQLSNGHFIVIDSGNNGTQKALSDFLRKKAPDGKPVVEAWIFTHFHQDHVGGFVEYMGVSSLTRYITVETVIYNFPQEQVIQTAHNSATDMKNMDLFYNKRKPAMLDNGTVFYQARTGQKYYFGNAEIEILWTFEDIMPCNLFIDKTNSTCIGFTITIEGQKIMVTGDSAEDELRMAANKFGSYLKSDILQLSHHGGGNNLGDHNLYKLANSPVVFHPNPNKNGLGANEKWAVSNAKLVIRSGNYGTATLSLPFKVGDKFEYTGNPVEENGK